MKILKKQLALCLVFALLCSILCISAGATDFVVSNPKIEASDETDDAILSPVAGTEYVSTDGKVLFSAAINGASGDTIKFLLDGEEFEEFTATADGMHVYSAKLDINASKTFWGYRTFTAEKHSGTDVTSLERYVKLVPPTPYNDVVEVYPASSEGATVTGYVTADGKSYYPLAEKPTSEYAGTPNPYIFKTNASSGYGEVVYYDEDGDGTKESIRATTVKTPAKDQWALLDSPYQDYIQILQPNTNLTKLGGIIEIKFNLKMHNTTGSRLCLLGLPGWVNNANNVGHFQVISNGKHTMFEDGTPTKEFPADIDITQWNEYKIQYDTDNLKWYFTINEGEENEYKSSADNATTKPGATSALGQYANGSKGILLGLYTYPYGNVELNGGFTVKDIHVSRKSSFKIENVEASEKEITNGIISNKTSSIKLNLASSPRNANLTADNIYFAVNGEKKDITNLAKTNTSVSFNIPKLAHDDKIECYIDYGNTYTIPGIAEPEYIGIKQGFSATAKDLSVKSITKAVTDTHAAVTVTVDKAELVKSKPLVLLCVYDSNQNLVRADTAFMDGADTEETKTLQIPLSALTGGIANYTATLYITEGNYSDNSAKTDYLDIRVYNEIDWQ